MAVTYLNDKIIFNIHHTRPFIHVSTYLVNIYTIIFRQLLVITISARVQELFIFFIFLWVQHIVTFLKNQLIENNKPFKNYKTQLFRPWRIL